MKFCIECGNKLPDAAKFCDRCGTKVADSKQTKGGKSKTDETSHAVLTKDKVLVLLDDKTVEYVKNVMETFKEDTDCNRIHIAGEDDFDDFLANALTVFKKRGYEDDVIDKIGGTTFALIDNSKSGQGRRGTLITQLGLVVIDNDIPNAQDGLDADGVVPWRCFLKFSEDGDDTNYCLMNLEALRNSDDVDDDVKAIFEDYDNDFMFHLGQTDLDSDQMMELVDVLKTAVPNVFEDSEDGEKTSFSVEDFFSCNDNGEENDGDGDEDDGNSDEDDDEEDDEDNDGDEENDDEDDDDNDNDWCRRKIGLDIDTSDPNE